LQTSIDANGQNELIVVVLVHVVVVEHKIGDNARMLPFKIDKFVEVSVEQVYLAITIANAHKLAIFARLNSGEDRVAHAVFTCEHIPVRFARPAYEI
jgi:hypothetical protein